ncbi:MAG: F0F1 ATP synthase subunit epsilon [Armatimonadetes bacterium]|jgi:F-type H+-transporting ATPase subunit epsilon|nr:F0F1 ATP synthase subunit epsilon [Armatimonadota bacterium]
MSEKTFRLEVITPDRVTLADDDVVSVVAPGAEGYLGVLANHAPMMASLGIGKLNYRRVNGETGVMALGGGFLEVYDNTASILAECAEPAENIDIARAEESKKRAKQRLAAGGHDIDVPRAEAALKRAINRLKIAKQP